MCENGRFPSQLQLYSRWCQPWVAPGEFIVCMSVKCRRFVGVTSERTTGEPRRPLGPNHTTSTTHLAKLRVIRCGTIMYGAIGALDLVRHQQRCGCVCHCCEPRRGT
jgi:hypothetical protein